MTPKEYAVHRLFMALVLLMFSAPPAWALSCAPPRFDESTIESAAAVFTGQALEVVQPKTRCLGMEGKRCISEGTESKTESKTGNRDVYKFGVQLGWKGAAPGFVTYVELDNSWGDNFEIGKYYLVVASEKKGDVWVSPLCGNTMPAEFATEQLKVLEQWCIKNKCSPSK